MLSSGSASPAKGSPAPEASRAASPKSGPIQPHEITAALPHAGITIADLNKLFQGRIGDLKEQTKKGEFIQMVKSLSKYGGDKLLRPK